MPRSPYLHSSTSRTEASACASSHRLRIADHDDASCYEVRTYSVQSARHLPQLMSSVCAVMWATCPAKLGERTRGSRSRPKYRNVSSLTSYSAAHGPASVFRVEETRRVPDVSGVFLSWSGSSHVRLLVMKTTIDDHTSRGLPVF